MIGTYTIPTTYTAVADCDSGERCWSGHKWLIGGIYYIRQGHCLLQGIAGYQYILYKTPSYTDS